MASKGAEYDYLKTPEPSSAEPSLTQRASKEWRQRWWLWSVVLFAVVVCGGLLAFRGSLYSQNVGMPLLAVTENAQELCDSKCVGEVGLDEKGEEPSNREEYEACLAQCVKGETEQVAEERKDFAEEQKKEEEQKKDAEGEAGDDKKSDGDKAEGKGEEVAEAMTAAEGGARRLRRSRLLL